jgi:hypothetical protein
MGVLQGDPLPNVTQTETKTTEAPKYFTDYLSGLSGAGNSALYKPGTYNATTGTGELKTGNDLVAGYDPMQTTGYGQFENAAGSYKGALDDATKNLSAGSGVSATDIQNFMNPYTTNVVDEMARLSQQNVQRNLLPSMKAGFVGTGGLGSQRYANAFGQSMADVQSDLTGKQYGALSAGYKDALQAAFQDAALQQKAAQLGIDLGAKTQELGLAGARALTTAGAEKQAYEQAKLDAPLKQASNVAALMRGYQVPTKETQTFVGPKAGLYQKSPLEYVMGIGSLLGSAKQGTLLDKLGSELTKKLFNPSGSVDPSAGGGSVQEGVLSGLDFDPESPLPDWLAGNDGADDYSWLTDYE